MGSLPITLHWERLIAPTIRDFVCAEDALGAAYAGDDADAVQHACYEALRLGMVGAILLYHFAEVAFERGAIRPPPKDKHAARALVSSHVSDANGDARPDDHQILGETADAIKHGELHSSNIVHVPKRGRVIEVSSSAPTIFSEGRPEGVPQVLIVTAAGNRSLWSIFENVGRGWNSLLGLPPFFASSPLV